MTFLIERIDHAKLKLSRLIDPDGSTTLITIDTSVIGQAEKSTRVSVHITFDRHLRRDEQQIVADAFRDGLDNERKPEGILTLDAVKRVSDRFRETGVPHSVTTEVYPPGEHNL